MAAPKKVEEAVTVARPSLLGRAVGPAFASFRLLRDAKVRRALYAGGMTVAAAALCTAIWRNVRDDVYALPEYQVPATELHITAAPAWLSPQADIRADVIRDASLDGAMSVLNDRLAVDIARDFALNPWIEEVVGVKKSFPARLDVEVRYRRPVCVVERPGESYVIDAHGVLLPREDVVAEEIAALPKLSGVDAPTSLAGAVWSDSRVVEAAAIATVLRQDWQSLGLKTIVPDDTPESTARGVRHKFLVLTQQNRSIQWGFAPQLENLDEQELAWKIGEIRNFQKQNSAPVRNDNPQKMEPTRRVEDLTLHPRHELRQ